MRTALKELAEQENIPKWQNAIAQWINQRQGEKVSLRQLQQALSMPLVEGLRLADAKKTILAKLTRVTEIQD